MTFLKVFQFILLSASISIVWVTPSLSMNEDELLHTPLLPSRNPDLNHVKSGIQSCIEITFDQEWGGIQCPPSSRDIELNEDESYNLSIFNLDLTRIGKMRFYNKGNKIAEIESNEKSISINVLNEKCNLTLSSSNIFSLGHNKKEFNLRTIGNFKALHPLKGNKIKIEAKSIHLEDEIEPEKELILKFKVLQLTKPYCHPFEMSPENEGYTSFLSFAYRPSKRISWESLRARTYLLTEDPLFSTIVKEQAVNREESIKSIFSSFQNNTQRENMAVDLVKILFGGAQYKFYETQMFNDGKGKGNGFDGLFVSLDNLDNVLVEVKYDKEGAKKPGRLNIGGENWRQLSTPYNKNRLKEMKLHASVKDAYNIINSNQENVRLAFIVLNERNLTLDWYNAGKFLESNLN